MNDQERADALEIARKLITAFSESHLEEARDSVKVAAALLATNEELELRIRDLNLTRDERDSAQAEVARLREENDRARIGWDKMVALQEAAEQKYEALRAKGSALMKYLASAPTVGGYGLAYENFRRALSPDVPAHEDAPRREG